MNISESYDVAIVGGGLAGLSLAIQCAEKKYNVILFEKEEYPFHKVCGEYISLESWNFIQRLGLQLEVLNLPIIKTLQLSDTKGKAYSFRLPLGGFGISRYFLDNELSKLALLKGVTICTNTKVESVNFDNDYFQISVAGKTIHAKAAAGSFGKRSNLDIKWQRPFAMQKPNALNNYIGVKYHIRYPHNREQIALYNFYNGYCGMSAVENEISCLCYLTTAENLKNCGNSITELERQVLYKNEQLKQIFSNATFLYNKPLTISQVSFNKKSQVEDHILLAGDSAGMISPLCGNGMSMAMHASKIAFGAISKFLDGSISRGQMEQQYIASWNKEFSKRLWMGRTVQRFFGGDLSTSLFIRTMHALPFVARQVIQATHGDAY